MLRTFVGLSASVLDIFDRVTIRRGSASGRGPTHELTDLVDREAVVMPWSANSLMDKTFLTPGGVRKGIMRAHLASAADGFANNNNDYRVSETYFTILTVLKGVD